MKKAVLFLSFAIISCLLSTSSFAHTADSSNVAAKSSEIVTLLSTKLGLTPTQIPKVQSLVTEFAGKFAKTNTKASTDTGLKEKIDKEEQSTLVKGFSTELPKILTATQSTQFATIKDKVSALFTQIK
ncbi:MAG: hypothetical protein JWO58_2990 [Chitinophagaceae bacterium]|nr:hypothetical protein [Chitinophagaceae bacterium]